MKVLHITNNYPTNLYPIFGIFVKEQIDSLRKIGIDNEIFFINGREKGKKEYIKSIYALKKKYKSKDYDIIHCHHALSAIVAILSGLSINKKIIISFQNDPINELGILPYKFIKKFTHGWIFKNKSPFIDNEYCFYLPNGVNTNFFKPISHQRSCLKLGLDPNKIYIIFVSSNIIRNQKRYDRFLSVLKLLKEKYDYRNIEEIKLINIKRDLIPYYYNAASVHLLTSDFEGSPNSVKECMACNTPIVSTNVGNVKSLLEEVKGGFVANSFSEKELAYLIKKAIKVKNPNVRERLFQLELDIQSVAIKLNNIYKKVLQDEK